MYRDVGVGLNFWLGASDGRCCFNQALRSLVGELQHIGIRRDSGGHFKRFRKSWGSSF